MDYEKLGAFYLGKHYDLEAGNLQEDLVLYDSKNLTTHAVIIGMTGSGKTGLGLGILEEALMDNIPLIAIDPKGDLGNLLLTFPELRPEDFQPWINVQEASNKGMSPPEYAQAQAELWRKGLGQWGQDSERIGKLRQAVDMAVYTPGSSAGLPVSVLRSFRAPSQALRDDADLYRERLQSTATSILALLGINADPVTSREHILLSNILDRSWAEEQHLDLPALIQALQNPGFSRIGVMDLDTFYPAKDRMALAMQLNNLLAAPGFEAWLEGEALDIQRMLYTPEGKPRASIFSIAHLNDSERMFFVTMLLNEILAWTRSQSGTGSLRAILYMDEIFGYLPPTANPPSKTPMLTLLKQARAYGLGLVLATQNPVDLDYKALSNAGTWFIGRLQTERDKDRVLEGLQGASAEGFNRSEMNRMLSSLGQRVFLLHSVNKNQPTIFQTRWVMSYLAGPMTREQLRLLMEGYPRQGHEASAHDEVATVRQIPVMPQGVRVYYASSLSGEDITYIPHAYATVDIHYNSARHKVNDSMSLILASELHDGPIVCDWDEALEPELSARQLSDQPLAEADFADLPRDASQARAFDKWQRELVTFIRQKRPLVLYENKAYKLVTSPGESEADFRARLAQAAREQRDLDIEKLKQRYASRFETLGNRLSRAEAAAQTKTAQVRQRQLESALSVGTALLSAFTGRKLNTATASRAGTALRGVGRVQQQQQSAAQAQDSVEGLREQILNLEQELEAEVAALSASFDPASAALEEVQISATATNISVRLFGLLWLPYHRDRMGRLQPDW